MSPAQSTDISLEASCDFLDPGCLPLSGNIVWKSGNEPGKRFSLILDPRLPLRIRKYYMEILSDYQTRKTDHVSMDPGCLYGN